MHYIDMSNSNTAAQTWVPEKRPHDPLSHIAFDISTTTKRLKSNELHQHVEYKLRSAELLDKRKKHDQVKHLGLCISAWTRRLKSDELDQSEQ